MIYGWGADWPDGFGFLQQIVDSRVIRAAGGNTNLGIKSQVVDGLVDQAMAATDTNKRNQLWGQVDKAVMDTAMALPGIWAKTLLYRPDTIDNVYVNDGLGGYYDYAMMGVKQ